MSAVCVGVYVQYVCVKILREYVPNAHNRTNGGTSACVPYVCVCRFVCLCRAKFSSAVAAAAAASALVAAVSSQQKSARSLNCTLNYCETEEDRHTQKNGCMCALCMCVRVHVWTRACAQVQKLKNEP